MTKPLIILTGPTAVGKTSLSIKLAKKLNCEIISADSMQVYKKMNIGTAKITSIEMQNIPHHLIDVFDPADDFSVYSFKNMACDVINEIYTRKNIPLIVGGTGFYIQSVLYDINFNLENNLDSYRRELEDLAKEKGNSYIFSMLEAIDPQSCIKIHCNDTKRIIRALEFYKQTGTKFSTHNENERSKKSNYNFKYFVLNMPRELLYERIDKRVDIMIESGLVDEVKMLLQMGYTKDLVSMKGLGYKEIIDYLEGNISLDEAIYIIKRDTRHFAKRQLTWFKREKDVVMINKDEFNYDEDKILSFILSQTEEII